MLLFYAVIILLASFVLYIIIKGAQTEKASIDTTIPFIDFAAHDEIIVQTISDLIIKTPSLSYGLAVEGLSQMKYIEDDRKEHIKLLFFSKYMLNLSKEQRDRDDEITQQHIRSIKVIKLAQLMDRESEKLFNKDMNKE